MTENEFVNLYWKQYIMLEKEFRKTVKYVALDSINFETYSDAYVKLLIQIGSEVDIVSTTYLNISQKSFQNFQISMM